MTQNPLPTEEVTSLHHGKNVEGLRLVKSVTSWACIPPPEEETERKSQTTAERRCFRSLETVWRNQWVTGLMQLFQASDMQPNIKSYSIITCPVLHGVLIIPFSASNGNIPSKMLNMSFFVLLLFRTLMCGPFMVTCTTWKKITNKLKKLMREHWNLWQMLQTHILCTFVWPPSTYRKNRWDKTCFAISVFSLLHIISGFLCQMYSIA